MAPKLDSREPTDTSRSVRDDRNGSAHAPARPEVARRAPDWRVDLLRGFLYALLIIGCILFFSEAASKFIYVDF